MRDHQFRRMAFPGNTLAVHELGAHLVPGIGVDAVGSEVQGRCTTGVVVLDFPRFCGNRVYILEGEVVVVRADQEQEAGIQESAPVEAQLRGLLQYENGEGELLILQNRPGRVKAVNRKGCLLSMLAHQAWQS